MSTQTTLTHPQSIPIRSMYDPSFVKPAIVDLYAYLRARADGALGAQRPEVIQ